MSYSTIKQFRPDRWLYLFLFAHFILWTLAPILVRYNLPMDAIEGTVWGHQLEWGYDKNPYLNGWLTALATTLDGQSGWMIYLFSQLCVISCMWATWQLAKNMLPPVYALISVLLLENIQYFNFHAIDFNDNTLELSLWALAIYYFYKALRSDSSQTINWILTGLFTGLGMMAKYYTITLIAGMGLFLLINQDNRKQLATLPPYLGLAVFVIVCLPHVIWLNFNHLVTLKYVFYRGSSAPRWINRFIYPAQFTWQQLEAFLPAIIPCALLFIGKKPFLNPVRFKIKSFDSAFLFYVACVPFLLTIIISLLLGAKLRAGWGMPLLSAWGIILIALLQPRITQMKIVVFLVYTFTLLGVLISGYSLSLMYLGTPTSANFPGREMAEKITQQWHDTYHTKLHYVGGSRWISGNISFYSPDHPAVFIEWNERRSPWINLQDLQQKGGVLVWDINKKDDLSEKAQNKLSKLRDIRLMEFDWHRNKNLPPIKLIVAMAPPSK